MTRPAPDHRPLNNAHIPEPIIARPPGRFARLCTLPFLAGIWVYRITLSPFIGRSCRFVPTCSRYGEEAYRTFGPIRGTRLTIARVLRCHPWSHRCGYDPVPLRIASPSLTPNHTSDPASDA